MSIRTKLIVAFVLTSLLPLLFISYYAMKKSKEGMSAQVQRDLTLAAELVEGSTLAFFERQKMRVADWSSDGHIRRETEEIIKPPSPEGEGFT